MSKKKRAAHMRTSSPKKAVPFDAEGARDYLRGAGYSVSHGSKPNTYCVLGLGVVGIDFDDRRIISVATQIRCLMRQFLPAAA